MKIVKWYIKGLFPIRFLIPFYIVILTFQFLIWYYYKESSIDLIININSLFLIPILVIHGALHITRNKETTVLEISLLRSWKFVSIGRIFSIYIFSLTFGIVEFLLTYLLYSNLIISILIIITLLIYSSLSLLASLLHSSTSILIVSTISFLFPIGFLTLISSYSRLNLKLPIIIQIFSWIFAPNYSYSYYEEGVITLDPSLGIICDIIFSIISTISYYELFRKLDFKI
ncbi:MAG: hypothetical protein QXO96_04500 [Sulfolobales archaeon]